LAVAVSEEEGPPQPPASPFAPQPPKRGKSNARMVVFGDSAFASNYICRIAPANYDLFMNTVNWLRGRLELVDIAPHTKKFTETNIEDKYYKMLLYPTILMFGLLVSVGGAVWIVRHRFQ